MRQSLQSAGFAILADAIARSILFAIAQPNDVDVSEIILMVFTQPPKRQ